MNRKTLNSLTILTEKKEKQATFYPRSRLLIAEILCCAKSLEKVGLVSRYRTTLRQNSHNLKDHPAVTMDNIPKIRPE